MPEERAPVIAAIPGDRITPSVTAANSAHQAVGAGVHGAAIHAGNVLNHDGTLRGEYQRRAARLEQSKSGSEQRLALRKDIGSRLTPLGQGITERLVSSPARDAGRAAKTPAQLAQSAPRTNEAVNRLGEAFRVGGRALLATSVAVSAYDIATAPPGKRVEVAAGEAGAWTGALAVGAEGAEVGFAIGSVVPGTGSAVGAAIGGLTGAAAGAIGGEDAGKLLYDTLSGSVPRGAQS
ncbi:MAG TPA: hypothetical protein VME66_07980 [Candidatus Acidoferrales bacterium]|nr:hypothetical protein [Candidatus Acidoferrales bacterium]